MKLNAEIIRVAPHFFLIDQFLGLAGSWGPSKVTFPLLVQEINLELGGRVLGEYALGLDF